MTDVQFLNTVLGVNKLQYVVYTNFLYTIFLIFKLEEVVTTLLVVISTGTKVVNLVARGLYYL